VLLNVTAREHLLSYHRVGTPDPSLRNTARAPREKPPNVGAQEIEPKTTPDA
jgi:hypothetical protein